MFRNSRRATLDAAKMAALDRSLASIIFSPDGTILDANGNFLSLVGYDIKQVRGRHHRMFVDPDEAKAPAYEAFWQSLRQGAFQAAQYRRFGKGGQEVWIQATYNPVLDRGGRVIQIVKFATDVTAEKLQAADAGGQISAINRSQAVIHFALNGTILDANEAFLAAVGYTIGEIKGQHHRLFVTSEERDSEDYAEFWRSLKAGNYRSGEFKRIRKSGDDLWLQASYNPILDMNGRPFKIVKYAADVTTEKLRAAEMSGQVDAIGRSQAVVHFAMDGTVLDANENFLAAMGYSLAEVKGRHHRMFVQEGYAASAEYENFWFKLRQGEYASGLYQRLGKGGRDVWIQGNYNPVLDLSGRPFKIVKYASDVTQSMSIRSRAVKAAEDTLCSMTTVTKAAGDMKVAADQITGHMRQSSAAVGEIQARTMAADRSTGTLRDAALAMDGIVQAITSITERINLLALNATIEAARAGPAGRGFAVVASEVKDLAAQATAATTQISTQINAMQSVSGDVGTALASIVTSVDAVKSFVAQAAQSVDRQAHATGEISVNMQTASAGVAGITRSLDDWVVGLDRRRERRDRVSQRAKIRAAGGDRSSDEIDCVVLNISVGGAKLKIGEARVPDRFLLIVEGDEAPRSCHVQRRDKGELGVMFV